jgi:hypothetical protein
LAAVGREEASRCEFEWIFEITRDWAVDVLSQGFHPESRREMKALERAAFDWMYWMR